MKTWIALFRGINVGGNNILPMAELRLGMESLGFENVRTYIQSGNLVLMTKSGSKTKVSEKIADWVENECGFRPQMLLLSSEEIQSSIAANPFPGAVGEPKFLHFLFLEKPAPEADLTSIEEKKDATESFHLTDSVFYLHAPNGIGRSKLAASAERLLGVVCTGRNYRTVEKILALAQE